MKTTLHVQRWEPWMGEVLRGWGSAWVKIVNPPPGWRAPDGIRGLGRVWTDDIDDCYIRQGREGGAAFVRDMLSRWQATPGIAAWELANEPDVNSNDGLAALNTYTIGAIEEAERRGLRLCIINAPEGNPSGDAAGIAWKWGQLAPCIRRAIAGGHYIGWHAYWRPGIEGPRGRYHALGRRAYDIEVLRGLGVDVSPLRVLINEAGIDGGIAGGPPERGWRDLSDADAYRAEIADAEAYARTIPQIEAVMLFTAGYEPPWGGFDVDEGFAQSLTGPLRAGEWASAPQPIAPVSDVERAIGEAIQTAIIPLNPVAAFERAGAARGLLPASREVDVEVGGVTYRGQAYRHPGERHWQHIVYCPAGDWSNLRWFTRAN